MSWNVNGIRAAASKGFIEWLAGSSPDVLCLQETKAHPDQLPAELKSLADAAGKPYHAYWASAKKKGYSGVAILSKAEPEAVEPLGDERFDDEGRVLIARYPGLALISAYFPNSQEGGARLPYKLDFCAAIHEKLRELVAKGYGVVLSGDYNIAHTRIDLANPDQNEGNPGFLPEERAWMDGFIGSGFIDSLRIFEKGGGLYTWWTYRVKGARERNIGWRLDYHCVNEGLKPRVAAARIHPEVMGSDHCPVEIAIA